MSDVHIDRLSLRLHGITKSQGQSIGAQVASRVAAALQGRDYQASEMTLQVRLPRQGLSEAQVVDRVVEAIVTEVGQGS